MSRSITNKFIKNMTEQAFDRNCDCGCEGTYDCVYRSQKCEGCGDDMKLSASKVCFTCNELETIRRYRLHNGIEVN